MSVNKELLNSIKITGEALLESREGMNHKHLYTELISTYPTADRNYITRAISGLVQDKGVVRIEYKLPNQIAISAFYLPAGSKLL